MHSAAHTRASSKPSPPLSVLSSDSLLAVALPRTPLYSQRGAGGEDSDELFVPLESLQFLVPSSFSCNTANVTPVTTV